MEESRNQLRSAGLRRRATADPMACRRWSGLIQGTIVNQPAYLAAATIAAYRPIGNEVDTGVIIDHAFRSHKRVFVPVSVSKEPGRFIEISHEEGCTGQFTVPVGSLRANELANLAVAPLVIIVPGVLFDHKGYRLGRGGGWYDRFLEQLEERSVRFGLAYEFQVVSQLPRQAWDQSVDFVVTESRVINCGV